MKQNEPKWSEVEQSGLKWWDPVNQIQLTRTWQNLWKLTKMDQWYSER